MNIIIVIKDENVMFILGNGTVSPEVGNMYLYILNNVFCQINYSCIVIYKVDLMV